MNNTSDKRLFRLSYHLWLTLGVSVALVASFAVYVQAEKRIDQANAIRQQSIFLADAVRQSSDDLTRMVRSYAVTGDAVYKKHFEEIIAVRDGRIARPADYEGIYWDLVVAGDPRPAPSGAPGDPVSLLQLIRQAGFTEEEIAVLALAKVRSDALTATEYAAMKLAEAAQSPAIAGRAGAIAMLYDRAYHQAKAEIMWPIRQFTRMTDQRTLQAVRAAEQHALQLRLLFILLAALLVVLVWMTRAEVQAILGGSVHELYIRIARLGSGQFASPVPVEQGREHSVLGWISATHKRLAQADAERQRAESQLADYRSGLENLVAERTRELASALHQAQAANRAKSVFLSNMSHELRTPLNAVIGFSKMMAGSRAMNEGERENLGIINRSGTHLLGMINDILEQSKIEAGQLNLREDACDVGALLDQVIGEWRPRAEQAGLTLALEAGPLPALLRVDAGKLRQVLTGLLGNAVKFTRQGGVALTVQAGPAQARGQSMRLVFSVRDSGIGIAPQDRQRIFRPFVQMVTDATSAGTGLGLSICRQYLQLMGSELELESAPGQGSTFRFGLTLEVADAAPAAYAANLTGVADMADVTGVTGVSPPAMSQAPGAVTVGADADAALDPGDIAQLDAALRAALCDAVRALDMEQLRTLLARIEPAHPQLARAIAAKAARFEYQQLWDALQQGVPAA
ncbi:MAG: ATP-binding protein [Pseudomonadota bacterium]